MKRLNEPNNQTGAARLPGRKPGRLNTREKGFLECLSSFQKNFNSINPGSSIHTRPVLMSSTI
jgi:hypothetical protein